MKRPSPFVQLVACQALSWEYHQSSRSYALAASVQTDCLHHNIILQSVLLVQCHCNYSMNTSIVRCTTKNWQMLSQRTFLHLITSKDNLTISIYSVLIIEIKTVCSLSDGQALP